MKFSAIILLVMGTLWAQTSQFSPLFNGKNFDGWYIKLSGSKDQTLINQTFGINTDSGWVHIMKGLPDRYDWGGGKVNGLMYTNKEYSKYVLRWEYKWGTKKMGTFDQWQWDAGVWVHCINDNIWPTALEYQIRYDHTKNDHYTGVIISTSTGYTYTKNGKFAFPENGGVKTPYKVWDGLQGVQGVNGYTPEENRWTTNEIVVMGNEYILMKVNGKVKNYVVDTDASKGKIAFQSETAEIMYRNIEIKEYTETLPLAKAINGEFGVTSIGGKSQSGFKPLQINQPLKVHIAGNQVELANQLASPISVEVHSPAGKKIGMIALAESAKWNLSLNNGLYVITVKAQQIMDKQSQTLKIVVGK